MPDILSRNPPPDIITKKTTVGIPQTFKVIFLAKDKTSPLLDCKYAVQTDIIHAKINNLQKFPLFLGCQNNHYQVDLLENSTFKPIPYSAWIKNSTQQKPIRQKVFRTDPFLWVEKVNLTKYLGLSGPPDFDPKYTINQVFNLHYPLDNIPFSKTEIENTFLPTTETFTLELYQKH